MCRWPAHTWLQHAARCMLLQPPGAHSHHGAEQIVKHDLLNRLHVKRCIQNHCSTSAGSAVCVGGCVGGGGSPSQADAPEQLSRREEGRLGESLACAEEVAQAHQARTFPHPLTRLLALGGQELERERPALLVEQRGIRADRYDYRGQAARVFQDD